MNRITALFEKKKNEGKKSLVIFITAGDPTLEVTAKLLPALEEAGADLIEVGVPFSDPIADGPTIQKASQRALNSQTTLKKIISMIGEVRQKTQIPLLLFSAYNPFLKYGLEKLVADAKAVGVDGFLVPDLPYEESEEFRTIVTKQGMHLIYLIAPTSPKERIRAIAQQSTGFIYYISLRGVTGARQQLADDIETHIREIKSATALPVVVGFGISRPEHIRQIAPLADGVVVGSAVVSIIGKLGDSPQLIPEVENFVSSLAKEL